MKLDAISLEILRSRLTSIVDQSGAALVRTAYSNLLRFARDFAVVLLDGSGQTLAQTTQSIPVFFGTMPRTAQTMLAEYGNLEFGDALITNDPWIGTGHLPDINVVKPVFLDPDLPPVAYIGIVAHMADLGGRLMSTGAQEVHEEGLRIPIMKVLSSNTPNESLLSIIAENSRVPGQVLGDVQAVLAAAYVAEERLLALLSALGIQSLEGVGQEIRRRGELAMRSAISQLSGGQYSELLTIEVPSPGSIGSLESDTAEIAVRVSVNSGEGSLIVDYEGTSPEVANGVNATFGYCYSYTVYALKCLLLPELPFNDGMFAPIDVRIPRRSILSCEYPRAVGARHMVGQFTTTAVMNALLPTLPDASIAECGSPRPFLTISGHDEMGTVYSVSIPVMGGFGARSMSDGPSALPFPTNTQNISIESLENASPLRVRQKELLADSGGNGRFRGGLGQRMSIELTSGVANLATTIQRRRFPAEGVLGGGCGSVANIWIKRAEELEPMELHMDIAPLSAGDMVIVDAPGGGGFGPASERDPRSVAEDLLKGYITGPGDSDVREVQ